MLIEPGLHEVGNLLLEAKDFADDTSSLQKERTHRTSTSMAWIHNLRSYAGSLLEQADFELDPAHVEFGRVRFRSLASGRWYQLKSAKSMSRDVTNAGLIAGTQHFPGMSPKEVEAPLCLVFYMFTTDRLILSAAEVVEYKQGEKTKFERVSPTAHVGHYLFEGSAPTDVPGFVQEAEDDFTDLLDDGDGRDAGYSDLAVAEEDDFEDIPQEGATEADSESSSESIGAENVSEEENFDDVGHIEGDAAEEDG